MTAREVQDVCQAVRRLRVRASDGRELAPPSAPLPPLADSHSISTLVEPNLFIY
jgi:hypothetical protein